MTPNFNGNTPDSLKLLWVFDGLRLWVMSSEPVTIFSTGNRHALEETHLIRLAHSIGFHIGLDINSARVDIERAKLDQTDSALINLLVGTAQESGYITLSRNSEGTN